MTRATKTHDWETPTLRASIKDGLFYSLMVGAGETYLPAFGIFLLGSSLQIGILTTLPPVIGAIFQYFGVLSLDTAKFRKKLISQSAYFHGLIWIPIALLPFFFGKGPAAVWILTLLVCAYHALLGFGIPIWNSLIGDLVPPDKRGEFFGRRNKLCGAVTFAALAATGVILDTTTLIEAATLGYALVFLFSSWCRLRSADWLNRYDDPEYHQSSEQRFSLWRFLKKTRQSNFAKFVLFVATMSFAVNISGPYFSIYMLRDLKFSYSEFMAITAMNIFAQFITIQRWGAFSDRFGNKKILTISAFGVASCPLIWLFTSNFWIIFFLHLYCGFVWAGFNLSAANFMFDAVTPPKRGRCSAYSALLTSFFVLAGSLAGGYIATHTTSPIDFQTHLGLPASPYPFIFFLSLILRVIVAVSFLKAFREVRDVESINHRALIFRIIHIRPLSGATFGIVSNIFRPGRQK
jgi:MFS family permease